MSAALRISFARSWADVRRQTWNPRSAAASAASRSSRPAWATVPIRPAVAGSSSENLYGMAESLYRPDMEPEDLFETVSQVLLAAVDRDAPSM